MRYLFHKFFVNLLIIDLLINFNVYKFIEWDPANIYLLKAWETLEKGVKRCEKYSKLIIDTAECRSSDLIFNKEL